MVKSAQDSTEPTLDGKRIFFSTTHFSARRCSCVEGQLVPVRGINGLHRFQDRFDGGIHWQQPKLYSGIALSKEITAPLVQEQEHRVSGCIERHSGSRGQS